MIRLPKIAHFSQTGCRSAFSGQISGLQLCSEICGQRRAENTLSRGSSHSRSSSYMKSWSPSHRLCKLHGYNNMRPDNPRFHFSN
jgi:hypothetical protein